MKLLISELECSSCERSLTKVLQKNNIVDFKINLLKKTLVVNFTDHLSEAEFLKIMKKSGYKYEVIEE